MNAPNPNEITTDQGVAVGVIETDVFCDKCGFNLHTQRVWRDERLGILVSRCPECGTHHAVGSQTTAGRSWVQRLLLIGVILWAGIVLSFVVGVFFLSFGIYAAAVDGLTYQTQETRDGKAINPPGWNSGVTTYTLAEAPDVVVQQSELVNRRRLTPALTGKYPPPSANLYYGGYSDWTEIIFVGGLLGLSWVLCGAILSAGSWFWRRGRRWFWLVTPILSLSFIYSLVANSAAQQQRYNGVHVDEDLSTSLKVMFVVAGLQLALLAISIALGRPIIRMLLSTFIPPKTRQLFSFLWHCDGKTMPAARPSFER